MVTPLEIVLGVSFVLSPVKSPLTCVTLLSSFAVGEKSRGTGGGDDAGVISITVFMLL